MVPTLAKCQEAFDASCHLWSRASMGDLDACYWCASIKTLELPGSRSHVSAFRTFCSLIPSRPATLKHHAPSIFFFAFHNSTPGACRISSHPISAFRPSASSHRHHLHLYLHLHLLTASSLPQALRAYITLAPASRRIDFEKTLACLGQPRRLVAYSAPFVFYASA